MSKVKGHAALLRPREDFRLEIVRLGPDRRRAVADVPVVNGWVQVNLPVRRVPSRREERAFFAALARLTGRLRRARLLAGWYFVHKPPGLRLRFRAARRPEALVAALDRALERWRFGWAGRRAFDSYFEQRELLAGLGDDTADRILCASAAAVVEAVAGGRRTDLDAWARFTVAFLERFLADRWLVWEALGRFERLRGGGPRRSPAAPPPHDPERLLARLPRARAGSGFAASTALLACLNYLYNQWALDAPAQGAVVGRARRLTAPDLARP